MRLLRYSAVTLVAAAGLAGRVGAQTMQLFARADTKSEKTVEVYADGNVKNVISQSSGASAVSGALGLRYVGPRFVTSGMINVAGTLDTVTSNWGASLLAPATGQSLNAGLLDLRIRMRMPNDSGCTAADPSLFCNQSIHIYSTIASRRWGTKVDTTPNGDAAPTLKVRQTYDVPVWGLGADYSIAFFDGTVPMAQDKASVAMVLDVGLATRHIRGDLYSRNDIRSQLLSTTRRDFFGPELILTMQVNQVRTSLAYYYMDGNVDGFSHGQVVAGVSISATLAGGEYSPK